jgi:nicotinamide-nucleotide adenylyltransferase
MRLGFIGRFQPFHRGHMHAVEQFRDDHEIVLIIANEESRTGENPLSFEERREILESCLDAEIFTQKNYPGDDERWSSEILEKTGIDGVITRNSRTREAIEETTDLEIREQEYLNRDIYSGTEIRRRIRSGEEWRYLVPDCAVEKIEQLREVVKKSGIDYEFEPGWKKENAFHGTEED